jgi:hypothetical protein
MQLDDYRREFGNSVGRAVHVAEARLAHKKLSEWVDELEYRRKCHEIDADTVEAHKQLIARRGLEIQQKLIPILSRLAAECLKSAGADAVRVVCAPIERLGTGRDGEPLTPISSGFSVPPEYAESPITAAVSAVKRAVTGRNR